MIINNLLCMCAKSSVRGKIFQNGFAVQKASYGTALKVHQKLVETAAKIQWIVHDKVAIGEDFNLQVQFKRRKNNSVAWFRCRN